MNHQIPQLPENDDISRLTLSINQDLPIYIGAWDGVIRDYVTKHHVWEPGVAEYMASLLPDGSTVVVGGGHVGISVLQLLNAKPNISHVHAFEPDPVNSALLTLNTQSFREQVSVYPMALGASFSIKRLARNPFNTGDNRLWDTIPAEIHAGGGDPSKWERVPAVVVPLDQVLGNSKIDFMFLDTQGAEIDLLKGATSTLKTQQPTILMEWWPRALANHGHDPLGFLNWLRQEVGMKLSIPREINDAPSWRNPEITNAIDEQDVERVTKLLADDIETAAYVELLATR